jgi:insecticidal toxin complex protein TccC
MPRFAGADAHEVCNELHLQGVRAIISIERSGVETWLDHWLSLENTRWYGSFLEDWHAPAVDHLHAYCETVTAELSLGQGAIATHCWGGTGRTGCFLAAYLIHADGLSGDQAFTAVRTRYNRHAVEMKVQYNALARYASKFGRTSLDVDAPTLDHAAGAWDSAQGDVGMTHDPGPHCDLTNSSMMVSSLGVSRAVAPFVSMNLSECHVQRVSLPTFPKDGMPPSSDPVT